MSKRAKPVLYPCGCRTDKKDGKWRWTFCDEAKRLYDDFLKTWRPEERHKYDYHFNKHKMNKQ